MGVEESAGGRVDAIGDAQIGELWHVLAYRVVQPPQTLLIQDHHGDARDGLGLGADAKDGVHRHGLTAQLPRAERLGLDHAAMPDQQRDGAGDLALIDHRLHVLV